MRSARIGVFLISALVATSADGAPARRLTLEDAFAIVARRSHAVAAARAEAERARAEVRAARSGYFPQINASGSYVRTIESEFEAIFSGATGTTGAGTGAQASGFSSLPFGRDNTWRLGLDVNQLIWNGGRTASMVDLAKAARRIAELSADGRVAQALVDVTQAYFDAQLADRLVHIAETSLALAERTLADARLGYQQGATAEFDAVRAEVTRDQQRTALVRARADQVVTRARLHQLLGLPLDQPLQLATELAVDLEVAPAAQRAAGRAGVTTPKERIAVAQARANVDSQRAQLRGARAQRWPELAAFSNFGLVQYPETVLPRDDWRRNWTIGITLAVPLFTGFRISAQIAAARAAVRGAEAELADTIERAAVDELDARTAVETAAAELTASTRSVTLAERAYQIAEVRYRQGVSTYLELADARLSLNRSRIEAARAARDLKVARVRESLLPLLPLTSLPGTSAQAATDVTAAARAQTAAPTDTTAPAPTAGAIPGTRSPTGAPTGSGLPNAGGFP